MMGFEPLMSGVGSNRSTNWATTTAQSSPIFSSMQIIVDGMTKNDQNCASPFLIEMLKRPFIESLAPNLTFSGPGRAGKKRWLGKIPDFCPKGQLVDSFSDILGSVSPIFFSPARSGFKTPRSTFEFFLNHPKKVWRWRYFWWVLFRLLWFVHQPILLYYSPLSHLVGLKLSNLKGLGRKPLIYRFWLAKSFTFQMEWNIFSALTTFLFTRLSRDTPFIFLVL